MRKALGWILGAAVLVLVAGFVTPAAATPAPHTYSVDAGLLNTTNQPVWAHQCAAMHCGYHAIDAGKDVLALCATDNEGFQWNLITAVAPWRPDIIIAGHADRRALSGPGAGSQQCGNVGIRTFVNAVTWAHSCPALSCGYGEMFPGHDIAAVCWTYLSDDGRIWDLLLDHDSANKNLAGFVPENEFAGPKSNDLC